MPLDANTHRASVTSAVAQEIEKANEDDDTSSNPATRPPSDAGSCVVNHGISVESLRQEILRDVAAAEQDTPYDRT